MKYLSLFVVLCLFVPSFAQRAKVIIDTVMIQLEKISNEIEIEQVKDGSATPEGYDLIGKGHFWTGPATIKCGERHMMQMTGEAARKIGAGAYRFYEVKEPNMIINTCYKAKILFLKKRE
jgi:hypothetical protein